MQFRLLTYNIHKGIGGVDRRYRIQRIVDTIQHCHPDIVFLQEVDDGVPRSRMHRQVDLLSEALDLPHRAFQANVTLRRGRYGNAILSRFPLRDVENLDLTIPLKKKRRALLAHCRVRFEGHSRTLLIYNLHLGLAGFERVLQLRRVLMSEVMSHAHRGTAVIVGGDFNDVWGTLSRKIMQPAGFQSVLGPSKTFPAFFPVRPLDRIFFRGHLSLDHAFVSRTEVAREASDHLPLVADFVLEAPPSAHT